MFFGCNYGQAQKNLWGFWSIKDTTCVKLARAKSGNLIFLAQVLHLHRKPALK